MVAERSTGVVAAGVVAPHQQRVPTPAEGPGALSRGVLPQGDRLQREKFCDAAFTLRRALSTLFLLSKGLVLSLSKGLSSSILPGRPSATGAHSIGNDPPGSRFRSLPVATLQQYFRISVQLVDTPRLP